MTPRPESLQMAPRQGDIRVQRDIVSFPVEERMGEYYVDAFDHQVVRAEFPDPVPLELRR